MTAEIVRALAETRSRLKGNALEDANLLGARATIQAVQGMTALADRIGMPLEDCWVDVVESAISAMPRGPRLTIAKMIYLTPGSLDPKRKELIQILKQQDVVVEVAGRRIGLTFSQLRRSDTGIEDAWVLPAIAERVEGIVATRLAEGAGSGPEGQRHSLSSELYFGLTLALGTKHTSILDTFKQRMVLAGYYVPEPIKISSLFEQVPSLAVLLSRNAREDDLYEFLSTRMDAGDAARRMDLGFLAKLAIRQLAATRERIWEEHVVPQNRRGVAYIFDSLMHPAEVEVLRETYGSAFFLIAFQQIEKARRRNLLTTPGLRESADKLFRSSGEEVTLDSAAGTIADTLLDRNRGRGVLTLQRPRQDYQLAIEDTMHLADVFFDAEDPSGPNIAEADQAGVSTSTVTRFVDLIFSEPFHTPSRSELGMAHAYTAALRSSSMQRRVGAALTTRAGEIMATGANEVPEPGGGEQWPVSENRESVNSRDHVLGDGFDSNDQARFEILTDLIAAFLRAGVGVSAPTELALGLAPNDALALETTRENAARIAAELSTYEDVRESMLFDITEFGRSVHAEMSAILSAARNGTNIVGSTLFCTTHPCHECARHIIAAGISRVIYIEPYAKSRALNLHANEIVLGRREDGTSHVEFFPFVGIAPRRQGDLYSAVERRVRDERRVGRKLPWRLEDRPPIRPSVVPKTEEEKTLMLDLRKGLEAYFITDVSSRIAGAGDPVGV